MLVVWRCGSSISMGACLLLVAASRPTLNGILLFALTPILAIAAVYARKLFDKTGNIWLAAFLNSILFTMITAANTAMFWNLMSKNSLLRALGLNDSRLFFTLIVPLSYVTINL